MTLFFSKAVAATGLLLLSLHPSGAANPDASGATISLQDEATRIGGIRTLFVGDSTVVTLDGIAWSSDDEEDGNSTMVMWKTLVDDEVQSEGTFDAASQPTVLDAGTIVVEKSKCTKVSVVLFPEGNEDAATEASVEMMSFRPGVSLIPLILILVLALTTRMVELSLFLGIWLGACMLKGSLKDGFKTTLDEFLVGALADEGHVFVILFSLFLSGAVGMMQKSGGLIGFTNAVSKIAKTPRAGQFACMIVGILIFFDDYANLLLTGETMRPLLDVLSVSREKLSFVVDATAAPIASISPISSWVGFEAGLVQEAIDTIVSRMGDDDELTIPNKGFAVFLQSIRYSYYSLFMIGMIAMLIGTQRDYGPMLVAERRVRVRDLKDGGPGASHTSLEGKEARKNDPREDQPLLMHNFLVPIILWIVLVFVILVQSGSDGSGEMGFIEKIENGDSYVALLYGTMGTAWLAMILYLLQITVPGTGVLAMPTAMLDMLPWRKAAVEERGDQQPRFLMSVGESVESFLFGMARIFLAIVILTLAWASGSIMTAIGVDRLFSAIITGGGIPYEILPCLTFLAAFFLGFATGTSWGTMGILFPLILVPTYEASDGDTQVFYSTVSAVLGGAVAGDHSSPISDTTVLSALACDVQLMNHVNTQAPYVIVVVIISMLLGYIPAGYGAYPNIVGILLGWVVCFAFVWFVCVPVLAPDGRWDIVTKLATASFCRGNNDELDRLAEECKTKAAEGASGEDDPKKEDPAPETAKDVEVPKEVDAAPPVTEEKSM